MFGSKSAQDLRRELQLASIPDIQGSIQANDNKSSAALVLHGLLFAGVLGVTAQIDPVFDAARGEVRGIGVGLLLLTGLFFALSVARLIRALRPPPEEEGVLDTAFFPRVAGVSEQAAADHVADLRRLDRPADVEDVYAREQVKLAAIRAASAADARTGFQWLAWELGAVGAYLLLVAAVAAGVGGLTRDVEVPRVGWTVDGAAIAGGGVAALDPARPAAIALRAGEEADDLRLSGTVVVACPGRPPETLPIAGRVEQGGATEALRLDRRLPAPACRGGTVRGTLVADVSGPGDARRRDELVLAPR